MASRITQPVHSLGMKPTLVSGAFQCNGTSSPTTTKGRGFTVARTSIGLYTLTFDDTWNECEAFVCNVRGADGAGYYCEPGDWSQSNRTQQIRVFDRRCAAAYPLDLGSAREISSNDIGNLAAHGGILATDSTPTYERINGATDKGLRVLWAASNSDEIQFSPIPMLPGMGLNDLSVHLYAVMSGTTDTPTIDVQAFAGVGDTEMGGATAALSDTLAEVSTTLTAANLTDHPGFLNISLVPGAHTTDTITLYCAWLESVPLVDLSADADNEIQFIAHMRNSSVNAG